MNHQRNHSLVVFFEMYKRFIAHFLIIIVLGFAYSQTIAPGLSWANEGADGGDLITAAAVNGVPHPTGYPLYMLVARFFQVVIPMGSLAWRANLLSAASTVAACLVIYRMTTYVVSDERDGQVCGLAAALMFGLALLVWSQAVIAEVYALQSLMTAIIVYQTIVIDERKGGNLLRGLVFGLALGNHITSIFLAPLVLLEGKRLRVSAAKPLLIRLAGVMAGACVYVILPLRAAQQPPVNWYDPVSLANFLQLITADAYQGYFSGAFLLERLRAAAGTLIENFGLPGVVLGLFAILKFKREASFYAISTWIFSVTILFALIYASRDAYVYLIQSLLAFSVWIGIGFNDLQKWMRTKWHMANGLMAVVLALFLGWRVFDTLPAIDASSDRRAENFIETTFEKAPEDAIIFTNNDETTFALWYGHFALGQRPDTAVIAEGMLQFDWYRETVRTTYPDLTLVESFALTPFDVIQDNAQRPFCFVYLANDAPNMRCSKER